MIPYLPVIVAFGRSWWKAAVGAAVVAGPVFLMGQCSGADAERDRAEVARVKANAAAVATNAAATNASADQRVKDAAVVANNEKALSDAVAPLPDAKPSDRRLAMACARLRQQGTNLSRVPECR